jgi:hypothetical protein
MKKPLNYENIWNGLTIQSRTVILGNLLDWITVYGNCTSLRWNELPTALKFELQTVDWEVSLGRRFASSS